MGLRPSVKKNESNDTREFSHDEGNRNSLPASPPALPPQREAWTARGQLLLNFHHAISRAINSSEMLRKCSQIAEDMSRSEQENTSPRLSPINEDAISVGSRQNCAVAEMKSHSMAEEYGAEAALIVENKSKRDAAVRNKSLALGIFSFAALRGGRGLGSWARRWIGNLRAGRSYQFESHLRPGTFMKNINNAESAVVESEQPSKLRRFLRVAFDATISTSIAFLSGAFLFMPRPSAYIEDMAKLPLVQGKSVYAEMVCPPLLREYRRVLEQYEGRWPVQGISSSASGTMDSRARGDDAEPQLTQEDVSLNVIRTFVENCSKRSKYERALLEERKALSFDENWSSSAVSRMKRKFTRTEGSESTRDDILRQEAKKLGTVSVPSPGVPENISVNLDQDIYSLATEDDREGDEENEQF